MNESMASGTQNDALFDFVGDLLEPGASDRVIYMKSFLACVDVVKIQNSRIAVPATSLTAAMQFIVVDKFD